MANQQAGGRLTLSLGAKIQILLWALGTMALFLSRAIDAGSERYPTHFTYTTPLYLRDVLGMIALARTEGDLARPGTTRKISHSIDGLPEVGFSRTHFKAR